MIPLIYVAGRYRAPTREAIAQNIDAARQVGTSAALLGWYPVIPHANTAHMELNTPHGDEFWLAGTLELMTRCDAVVLVPGWETSEGTKGEIAKARELRMPVYETLDWLPPATDFEPVVSSNSPKYKAELYDEVWQTATDMGYSNVTMALAELATVKAQGPSGLYAIHYRDNWDGEGDTHYMIAEKDSKGRWLNHESTKELLEFEGDAILRAWPLSSGCAAAETDVLLAEAVEVLQEVIDAAEAGETLGSETTWRTARVLKGRRIYVDDRAIATAEDFKMPGAEVVQVSGAVPFEREERYMIVKLSRLSDDQGDAMSRGEQIYRLAHFGKALVECVVVESDWPEYQATWEAIERRVLATSQAGATAKAGE